MSIVNALLSFTTPGTFGVIEDSSHQRIIRMSKKDDPILKWIEMILPRGHYCDTKAAWGCLNQDWYEVECEIDTSFGWCEPTKLSKDEKEALYQLLDTGRLLMMVYYIRLNDDGTVKEYEPHH